MQTNQTVLDLAERVKKNGGVLYVVGGQIRDQLMVRPCNDWDCEVFGLTVDQLEDILYEFGEINKVGSSFAVYKIGQTIDVSLPRKDRKTGDGHRAFEISVDPFMSTEQAS